jgi:hypothetical protein
VLVVHAFVFQNSKQTKATSDDTTDDIQIFSLSTLEVVRTIKICNPVNGKTWHLLRNRIIMGPPDETIRQFYLIIFS